MRAQVIGFSKLENDFTPKEPDNDFCRVTAFRRQMLSPAINNSSHTTPSPKNIYEWQSYRFNPRFLFFVLINGVCWMRARFLPQISQELMQIAAVRSIFFCRKSKKLSILTDHLWSHERQSIESGDTRVQAQRQSTPERPVIERIRWQLLRTEFELR